MRFISVVSAKSLDISTYLYKNYCRLLSAVSQPTTVCTPASPPSQRAPNGTYSDLNSSQSPTKSTLWAGAICPQSYSQTRHLLIAWPKPSPKMPSQEISFRILTQIVTCTQLAQIRVHCFDIRSQITFHSARTLRINFSVNQTIRFKRAQK